VLETKGLANLPPPQSWGGKRGGRVGQHFFYTSGDPKAFAEMVERLIGERGQAQRVKWGTDAETLQRIWKKAN